MTARKKVAACGGFIASMVTLACIVNGMWPEATITAFMAGVFIGVLHA